MSQGLMKDMTPLKAKINLLEGMAKSLPRIALTPIYVPYTHVGTFVAYHDTPSKEGYRIHRIGDFLNNSKLIGACEHGFDIFRKAVREYRKNKQEIQHNK